MKFKIRLEEPSNDDDYVASSVRLATIILNEIEYDVYKDDSVYELCTNRKNNHYDLVIALDNGDCATVGNYNVSIQDQFMVFEEIPSVNGTFSD